MLQKKTVTAETLALIKRLMIDDELGSFNLVGGTALALHIGHRTSIDIDLFSTEKFNAEKIGKALSLKYEVDGLKILRNGIFCFIEDIKVDIISHQYPLVNPIKIIEGIRLISIDDIAAMKLQEIVQNGQRIKDFVDIYSLLEHKPLGEFYAAYERKYHPNVNRQMGQAGLLYYDEIDLNIPVSFLDKKFEWPNIVKRIKEAAEQPQKKFFSHLRKGEKRGRKL